MCTSEELSHLKIGFPFLGGENFQTLGSVVLKIMGLTLPGPFLIKIEQILNLLHWLYVLPSYYTGIVKR